MLSGIAWLWYRHRHSSTTGCSSNRFIPGRHTYRNLCSHVSHGIGPAVFVSAAQTIFISRLKVYLTDLSTQANATLLGDSGLSNMISHVT
jgi:hypothetical protein